MKIENIFVRICNDNELCDINIEQEDKTMTFIGRNNDSLWNDIIMHIAENFTKGIFKINRKKSEITLSNVTLDVVRVDNRVGLEFTDKKNRNNITLFPASYTYNDSKFTVMELIYEGDYEYNKVKNKVEKYFKVDA